MKKVISALTVAAMCASMAASTIPAFAVYKEGDVSTYLKVTSDKGTVSADGKTVTFASAADAASAKIVVSQYLVADTSAPSIQQIGALYTTNSTKIKLGDENGVGVDYASPVGEAKEYTLGGNTFTTDMFVTCFSYYTKLTKKFSVGNGNVSWGHSDKWQGDGWKGNGDNDVLILQWATDFKDKLNHPTDYTETAHFATDKSDDYPLTQFDVRVDSSITDGTYTVDFLDSYTHPEYGVKQGNWINVNGKDVIGITETAGITIKVGNATENPTEAPTQAETEAPTQAATEAPTEKPTEATNPGEGKDISKITEWTWVVDDTVYNTKTDEAAFINVLSAGTDPGVFGYDFNIEISDKDGKNFQTLDKAGFIIADVSQGDAYDFNVFQPNMENGHVGTSETRDTVKADYKAKAGSTIATYTVLVPEGMENGVYQIRIIEPSAGNYNKEPLTPAVMGGTLTITDGTTTPPEPATNEPTQPASDEPTQPATAAPGSVLYGDVNEDGKVELVDVVKLNRFLTGLDASLSATATINANCYRSGGESDADTTANNLNGKDTMEILKVLIGTIAQADLPTKA